MEACIPASHPRHQLLLMRQHLQSSRALRPRFPQRTATMALMAQTSPLKAQTPSCQAALRSSRACQGFQSLKSFTSPTHQTQNSPSLSVPRTLTQQRLCPSRMQSPSSKRSLTRCPRFPWSHPALRPLTPHSTQHPHRHHTHRPLHHQGHHQHPQQRQHQHQQRRQQKQPTSTFCTPEVQHCEHGCLTGPLRK